MIINFQFRLIASAILGSFFKTINLCTEVLDSLSMDIEYSLYNLRLALRAFD